MSAHVRLLGYVRKIERREHRIFLDAQERVAKLDVATIFCLSNLYLTPEAVVLMIRQQHIGAGWSSNNYIVCLRVGNKVQQDSNRETFAVFQFKARQQVYKIE